MELKGLRKGKLTEFLTHVGKDIEKVKRAVPRDELALIEGRRRLRHRHDGQPGSQNPGYLLQDDAACTIAWYHVA